MRHTNAIGTMAAAMLLTFTVNWSAMAQSNSQEQTVASLQALIEDVPTTQAFLDEPVPQQDLERIVNAGINAPSAMNMIMKFSYTKEMVFLYEFSCRDPYQ